MRENRLKATWRAGGAALGVWLSIPDAVVAEALDRCRMKANARGITHAVPDTESHRGQARQDHAEAAAARCHPADCAG